MKKLFLLLALLFVPGALRAQNHSVTLSWVLSVDDTSLNCASPNVCSQTVYRALGTCSASSNFTQLATPGAATVTYVDSTVTPGNYCYAVTFTSNGLESVKATVSVSLPPAPDTSLTAVPK